jgi:uncharacterized protein YndB with AHSA1/START domain
MRIIEKFIEINAPVERVFHYFGDFENCPSWMLNVLDVRYTRRRTARWTVEAQSVGRLQWETETVCFEPDHRIAWRTLRGDLFVEGEAIFAVTRRGTTSLRFMLAYDESEVTERLFGADRAERARRLEDNLERFARLVERTNRARRDFSQQENMRPYDEARVREDSGDNQRRAYLERRERDALYTEASSNLFNGRTEGRSPAAERRRYEMRSRDRR